MGPETSKEELQELYLEVYKLHRLLGSPPGEPALLEEVLSSLEGPPRAERQEWTAAAMARPHPEDPHSSRSSVPRERKERQLRWKEVWLQFKRPTKKHWLHGGYPQRRDRKVKLHLELLRNKGEIQE